MFNESLFKAHFIKGMKNKDFEAFKSDYPTLFNCIIAAMDDLKPPPCPRCDHYDGYTSNSPGILHCNFCMGNVKVVDVMPNSIIFK